MTTLREAAQQALEALHVVLKDDYRLPYEKIVAATDALRAALAEHDKKIVWVEERKAHWAEQLQLARETQERERQQREEAALAEPVQEPVAWAVYDIKHGGSKTLHWPEQHSPNGDPEQFKAVPLYIAPPQRKPLTDEELDALAIDEDGLPNSHIEFARAIERAHGITGDRDGSQG